MAKKIGYTPTSVFAAGCGTIATAAAASNPATAPFAVGIGTVASAVAGGIEFDDEEKNIKENLDKAMDTAWNEIARSYRLYDAPNCLSELKQEIMGEGTSVDEFVRNIKSKGFEPSLALVIQRILEKHRGSLNRDPVITWSDEFIENAAKESAAILVNAIKGVLEKDDQLKILKAIADSKERIVTELHQARDRIIGEIGSLKPIYAETPLSLTVIPPAIDLIGRENDIKAIRGLIERLNIVSIHADGGVGKTAVAAKIINQIKKEIISGNSPYKHVAWLTSTGNLESDLTGLNVPLMDAKMTQEEKYQIVSTYLQSNPTLLVIDNMDELPTPKESGDLNTLSGQTKIIITSRAYMPYAEEYLLTDLDNDSALVLFYRHFTRKIMTIENIRERKDYSYGESIVKAAIYNALFIELIGKMAYADHWKLGDLWERISFDVFGLDSKHPIHATHGDDGKLLEHIQKLYKMSGLSERQKEIMSFIALFPAEHRIFFDVFEWAGFEDDEEDHLEALKERGWVVRDEEGYLIHTMVKGSIEQQDKGIFDENRYEWLIKNLANTDQYMSVDKGFTVIQGRIVVPETICRLLVKQRSKKSITSVLFNNIAFVYHAQGNYVEALKYYNLDLSISVEKLGKDHQDTATTYNNVAGVYEDQGNYSEALKYYNRALSILEKRLGKDHPSTATTYDNIAGVYENQGYYAEALKYYNRALSIREEKLGKDHPSTAATYNNIAKMYEDQRNYAKALKYYNRALSICEEKLGKDHPFTALCVRIDVSEAKQFLW